MFDRRSQFDRSFFDRAFSSGPPLPARIAGEFTVVTRTSAFIPAVRTEPFMVVAFK